MLFPNILAVNKFINREAYQYLFEREIRFETNTLGPLVFLLNRPTAILNITTIGLQLATEYEQRGLAFKETCTFIAEHLHTKTPRVYIKSLDEGLICSPSILRTIESHGGTADEALSEGWVQSLTTNRNLEALDIIFYPDYPASYQPPHSEVGPDFVRLMRSTMLRPGSLNSLLTRHMILDSPATGWLYTTVSDPSTESYSKPRIYCSKIVGQDSSGSTPLQGQMLHSTFHYVTYFMR